MQENSPFNPVTPSPSSTANSAADSATPAFSQNTPSTAPSFYAPVAPAANAPAVNTPTAVAPATNESGASSWGNAMDQTAAANQVPASGAAVSTATSGEAASLKATRDSGARWFLWIAALSLVNALLMSFGSDHTFSLGLGSTLLVDAVAKDVATKTPQLLAGARLTEFLFDGVIIGMFALFGFKALRGKKWAFLVGGVLLALDTLLVLIFQMWIGVLIHAWAVFSIFTAMSANSKLQELEKTNSQSGSAWS